MTFYLDFLHSSSSSKSSTRPYSTTEPNKSTEHGAIQKGSVHCAVVASNLNRLLSTIFIIDNFGHSCWAIFICFSRLELYINFALLKLFVKPDHLLLEGRRSETSSKGHNQTTALLLIELAVVQLVNLLAHQGKTNDDYNEGWHLRFFFNSCLESEWILTLVFLLFRWYCMFFNCRRSKAKNFIVVNKKVQLKNILYFSLSE